MSTVSEKLEQLLKDTVISGISKTEEIRKLTEEIMKGSKEEIIKSRKVFKKYLTLVKNKIKAEASAEK